MNDQNRLIRLIMELRQTGIADTRILSVIERIPRDLFVLPNFADQAYENTALPIEQGQTISQPFVVAFMTGALELGDRHRVLEVGTGSGYQAAILSKLCRRVFTVERYRSLLKVAEQRFRDLDMHNIVSRHGDGAKGWPEQAPFDRIIVTAAAEEVPKALLEQLKDDGGIMVIPVGKESQHQDIVRIRRNGDEYSEEKMLPVRFVPLVEGTATEKRNSTTHST
ncbi:MAG: protein-L-isoaspartate(D-aspartate) O-methyltransferase [Alphaproteobacteria bacterium]|nr:protein-L-isoaspartate(D-aspartate) O-methyltransferase [Alphaproteobacteria bacterium]MBT4018222.1 protein-L-isoaspartate(D-aspartate) O-methyltransferase [Alphaproteobacteria bacterium]MBT4966347.1 protein-L-isoaspartate(D-aspartate) O-methyltransferase [Alphaproteobacteria bacterium]MBT5160785.1 protein-L-isoaspartate(D-aspartate) O-methyltransferase [Alphaproteobacteria bacterium]MBT5919562.1 protein-L-isoaspartate(D-aspartate) O-methyltransferase [Alphaproteobacteria bacterium]